MDNSLLVTRRNRHNGNIVDPTARLITLQRGISVELRDAVHVSRNNATLLVVKRDVCKDIARDRSSDDHGSQLNCKRTDKSFAVVRMLSDEIHTTGSISVHGGFFVERLRKLSDSLITQFASHSRKENDGTKGGTSVKFILQENRY